MIKKEKLPPKHLELPQINKKNDLKLEKKTHEIYQQNFLKILRDPQKKDNEINHFKGIKLDNRINQFKTCEIFINNEGIRYNTQFIPSNNSLYVEIITSFEQNQIHKIFNNEENICIHDNRKKTN